MNPCNSSTRGPFSLAKEVDWRCDYFSTSPADLYWPGFSRETLMPMNWLNERWLQIGELVVILEVVSCESYLILNNSRIYYIHIYTHTHDTFTSGWLKYPDWSETQIEAMLVFVCFASQTCKNETRADLNKYKFIGSKLSKVRQKIQKNNNLHTKNGLFPDISNVDFSTRARHKSCWYCCWNVWTMLRMSWRPLRSNCRWSWAVKQWNTGTGPRRYICIICFVAVFGIFIEGNVFEHVFSSCFRGPRTQPSWCET